MLVVEEKKKTSEGTFDNFIFSIKVTANVLALRITYEQLLKLEPILR